MEKKHAEKRIEAVHDTVKQARSALLLCILASGAMFLCLWNTYASWDRDFAFLDSEDYVGVHVYGKDPDKLPADNRLLTDEERKHSWANRSFTSAQTAEAWENHNNGLPTHLPEHQLHSWIDTQVVSVALLGIKISVSDFAILGSVALFICSLYLLLCVRRENHEIGYLFRDIFSEEQDVKDHGYQAYAMVSSYMVFNITGLHGRTDGVTDSRTDGVICSLKKEPVSRRIPLIRGASSVLDFFPAITVLTTILCDFGWTFTKAKYGHVLALSAFRAQTDLSVYFSPHGFSPGEKVYFWCAEVFAVIAACILFRMSYLVRNYDRGTRDLLGEVSEQLISQNLMIRRWPLIKEKGKGAGSDK